MSECVVRMEMPSCCHDCPFEADQWDYPICRVTGRSEGYRFDARNNRMVDCPIICSLPEGHGRLVSEKDVRWAIDDIVLEIAGRIGNVPMTKNETMEYVNQLPTIVPAERSET